MNQHDFDQFTSKLSDLFSAYNKPSPEAPALRFWANALKPYSLPRALKALELYANNERFAPVPATVVKYLRDDTIDDTGVIGCAFMHDGNRCPLVGHHKVGDRNLCTDHRDIQDEGEAVAFMYQAIERKLPYRPRSSDVLLARRMKWAAVREIYGDEMIGYLQAHPQSETHPAWGDA